MMDVINALLHSLVLIPFVVVHFAVAILVALKTHLVDCSLLAATKHPWDAMFFPPQLIWAYGKTLKNSAPRGGVFARSFSRVNARAKRNFI